MKSKNEIQDQLERFERLLLNLDLSALGKIIIDMIADNRYMSINECLRNILELEDICATMYHPEKLAFYDDILKMKSVEAYINYLINKNK